MLGSGLRVEGLGSRGRDPQTSTVNPAPPGINYPRGRKRCWMSLFQGLECMVFSLWFMVWGLWFRAQGLGLTAGLSACAITPTPPKIATCRVFLSVLSPRFSAYSQDPVARALRRTSEEPIRMLNGSSVLQCRARPNARLAFQHPSHFARPISQPFARHSSLVCLFWGEEVHGDFLQTGDGRPTNSFVTKRLKGPEKKKPALINPPRKHLYSPGRRIWRLRSGEAHPRICPFPSLLLFFPWPKNPRPGACSSFQDRFCVHHALCSSVAER